MRPRWSSFAFVALSAAVARAESPEQPTRGTKMTLEQVMTKALAGPKVQMALADKTVATARVDEVSSLRLPRAKATAFGTAGPKIRCLDATCTITDPTDFAFRYQGIYGAAQLEVTQPLFDFGKLDHIKTAARAGVAAQAALVDEAAGDVAVDAAKAYWGVKLSKELLVMLGDGIEHIQQAIDKMNEQTGTSAPSVQDRQRVAVLLAEAQAQQADAEAAHAQALAGLRALVGVADADVDDNKFEELAVDIPASVNGNARPQAIAAREGANAADEIVRASSSFYFPDIALVGNAQVIGATGAQEAQSAYLNDYNRTYVGIVVNLTWNIDPFRGAALKDKVDAEAKKAHALAALAAAGASYDAQTALAELTAAKRKVEAAKKGEAAGHTWVLSVLQGEAIGLVESKDLADAYIAYFQMHARLLQAVYQLNVAVVRLRRATGECRIDRRC